MKKINIFVSSDMNELEYEREIVQEVLQEMNFNPILFEIFPALNQSPSEAYVDEVRNCDIFVIILWKYLKPAVFVEYTEAVRSNKPIIILVKSLIGNENREVELKTFLDKLSDSVPHQMLRRTVYKNFRHFLELKHAIKESVIYEITKFYKEPIHTLSREEMYELGKLIIKYAQKRLFLFQKTPSLILGARNYLATDSNKYIYEMEFLKSLEIWIEENYKIADIEFLYFFSLNATREELKKHDLLSNAKFVARLKDKITYYKNIEVQSGYRFRIGTIDIPISGPLIVGDNRYALWLLGDDDAVSISQENEKISDILVRILKIHSQKKITDTEIISSLGLEK